MAQNDSIITYDENIIVGEIKHMDRGVITIETAYSNADFEMDWEGIKRIISNSYFLFTTSDGLRMNGSFRSKGDDQIELISKEGRSLVIEKNQLVYIKSIDQGFLSRLKANIDLGYSLTKANNLEQFTVNSRASYIVERWSTEAYFNSLFSKQDSIANVQRNDGGLGYRFFLPRDWYFSVDLSFLTNTEQALDLRTIAKSGLGKYVIHTNNAYWGFGAGVSANLENYSQQADTSAKDRQSWEGYLGTELNLYDIGDLNLFTSVTAYPSITEKDRWRIDARFDAKYDLPLDFYIRAGVTVNYDNQPAIKGNDVDYVFTTGFGWEW